MYCILAPTYVEMLWTYWNWTFLHQNSQRSTCTWQVHVLFCTFRKKFSTCTCGVHSARTPCTYKKVQVQCSTEKLMYCTFCTVSGPDYYILYSGPSRHLDTSNQPQVESNALYIALGRLPTSIWTQPTILQIFKGDDRQHTNPGPPLEQYPILQPEQFKSKFQNNVNANILKNN